ncbi:MAG: hypothetical protein ACRC7R_08465 [Sarcina sp.]
MLNKRKLLTLGLVALSLVGVLSACAKNTSATSTTKEKELKPIIIQGAMDVETEKLNG